MRSVLVVLGCLVAGILGSNEDVNSLVGDAESIGVKSGVIESTLSPISRMATRGSTIDINLFQIGEEEVCSLISPNDAVFTFEQIKNSELDGVTAQSSSPFVSCRVTFSPMADNLLGRWTIVGSYVKDGVTLERRQVVTLRWHNNPNNAWAETVERTVDQVVHFGATFNPQFAARAVLQSCHVVTPLGEDLLLLEDSLYPNISLIVNPRNTSICSVLFGPVHSDMIGDWSMYGIYGPSTTTVLRRPLHVHLYDEENPYSQAFNRTLENPQDIVVSLGFTTRVQINGTGDNLGCLVRTPDGERHEIHSGFNFGGITLESTGNVVACRIALGPIVKEMLGDWVLYARFYRREVYTEHELSFRVIQEDPENPLEDNRRNVTYLSRRSVDTELGESHTFTIDIASRIVTETCHIRLPNGLQYIIMDGFDVPGVVVIPSSSRVSCGVTINLISEDLIGEWMLIARELHNGNLAERRMPINLNVYALNLPLPDVMVETSPSDQVTVALGNDFYIRLAEPTDRHATCKLIASNGELATRYEFDSSNNDRCGYIIRDVTASDSGVWEINYGTNIIYRAQLRLNIQGTIRPIETMMEWTRDRPVNMSIGPENAVYCRIEDPTETTVFNEFRMCRIDLARVTAQHAGVWKVNIALPGRVVAEEYSIQVYLQGVEETPEVTTAVRKDLAPAVLLSCSVSTRNEIRTCKFRDPHGRVLLASHGLGEDRYTFHGSGASFVQGMYQTECGLRINNPRTEDLGMWRCAIETNAETLYGFLTVICPWAMMDPVVAAQVVAEPVLVASNSAIDVVAGQSARMLCKIASPIRYCYFRSQNGTVISLTPGTSTANYDYVGEGFVAGECGLLIKATSVQDSGTWSCNVGLSEVNKPEYREHIRLQVTEPFSNYQYLLPDTSMVLGGQAYQSTEIEYCRFIRMDGLAFTSNNLPSGYTSLGEEHLGHCGINVRRPSFLDRDRWTIATKISGQTEEIYVTSTSVNDSPIGYPMYAWVSIYATIAFLSLLLIILVLFLLVPKSRRKIMSRTASIRDSIKRSFRKEPLVCNDLPTNIITENNTSKDTKDGVTNTAASA